MKKTVIYAGTFDPITLGHIDVVTRALSIFGRIIIGIADNQQKSSLFSLSERIQLARDIFITEKNVEVDGFTGMLTDFAKLKGTNIILRGLRVVSDFDYEFQIASINRMLSPEIETVFLTPSDRFTYLSSSMVREIAKVHGDVSQFVPPSVVAALKNKFL